MLSTVDQMPGYHFYGKTLFNALLVLQLAERGRDIRWYFSSKHHCSQRSLRLSNHSIDQFRIFLKKHDISAKFLIDGSVFDGWKNRSKDDWSAYADENYASRTRYIPQKQLFDVLMTTAKSFGVEIIECDFFPPLKNIETNRLIVDVDPSELKGWPQAYIEAENLKKICVSEWKLNNISESNFPIPYFSQIESTSIFLEPAEKNKAVLAMIADNEYEIDNVVKHLIAPRGMGSRMLHALFIVNSGAERSDYRLTLGAHKAMAPGGFGGPRFAGQIFPSFIDYDEWSIQQSLSLFKVLKDVEPYGDFNYVLRASEKWHSYLKSSFRALQNKSLLWNRLMFSKSITARKYVQWTQRLPNMIRKRISLP